MLMSQDLFYDGERRRCSPGSSSHGEDILFNALGVLPPDLIAKASAIGRRLGLQVNGGLQRLAKLKQLSGRPILPKRAYLLYPCPLCTTWTYHNDDGGEIEQAYHIGHHWMLLLISLLRFIKVINLYCTLSGKMCLHLNAFQVRSLCIFHILYVVALPDVSQSRAFVL